MLDAEDDITVVGEASDGAEAFAVYQEVRHRIVVLMDIRMPGVDGLTATRATIIEDRRLDGVRVLILTTFEIDEYVYEALRAGASGFLVKHTEPAELISPAVRVVGCGSESLLSPGARAAPQRGIRRFGRRESGTPHSATTREVDDLTARQSEVVALVADGLSIEESPNAGS